MSWTSYTRKPELNAETSLAQDNKALCLLAAWTTWGCMWSTRCSNLSYLGYSQGSLSIKKSDKQSTQGGWIWHQPGHTAHPEAGDSVKQGGQSFTDREHSLNPLGIFRLSAFQRERASFVIHCTPNLKQHSSFFGKPLTTAEASPVVSSSVHILTSWPFRVRLRKFPISHFDLSSEPALFAASLPQEVPRSSLLGPSCLTHTPPGQKAQLSALLPSVCKESLTIQMQPGHLHESPEARAAAWPSCSSTWARKAASSSCAGTAPSCPDLHESFCSLILWLPTDLNTLQVTSAELSDFPTVILSLHWV